MTRVAIILLLLLGSAFSAGAARAQPTPDRIAVVWHEDVMFFSLEETGAARFRVGDSEDWSFQVTPREYRRIRDLLRPYREGGLVCDDPNANPSRAGYILWRDDGRELRRPHETLCYTDRHDAASRNISRAYDLMQAWARARWTPPPALPAPERMTLVWRSWGNRLVEWTLPRGGEGRYIRGDGPAVAFPVSVEQFDAFRAVFAPYEGVRFECRRTMTDGAYGSVIWSQSGHEDQALNFDAGCLSGDAADVFERLDQAEVMLNGLKGTP
jgi:hypothetical protein